ncbi:MAG: isocitrate lyase/phosphoenolpyruvate mutase family protein, partial [Gemmatimonadota bacterium]|nr:isocitrate lyase/phosphoenolpyruvate mutase family protein [Gemmatimonadota bacterium]
IAFSLGYDDGQNISLDTMLEAVGRIAGSVDVPVTADMERRFGDRSDEECIPLVINARTDVSIDKFVGDHETQVAETIRRGKAYFDSGADCFYPIHVGDTTTLKQIHDAVQAPMNVLALANTAPMRELETISANRLSLGPRYNESRHGCYENNCRGAKGIRIV